jgi:hypothetical protein
MLLVLAVLGPAVTIALGIAHVRAHWVEVIAGMGGLVGIPLLCIWCAMYVESEPRFVRIALIWIAGLFLFVLVSIIAHPYVY